METKKTTAKTAFNAEFFNALTAKTTANNSKDIYNLQGKFFTEIFAKCNGNMHRTRIKIRDFIEGIADAFSKETDKKGFALGFWSVYKDNFYTKQIASNSRAEKNANIKALQNAINEL